MKKIRIVSGILAIASLLLGICWCSDLFSKDPIEISSGMSALYACILFVAFLSTSLASLRTNKLIRATLLFSFLTIGVGTIVWISNPLLMTMGSITIMLLYFSIATSLLSHIDIKSTTGKVVAFLFIATLVYLSTIVMIEATPLLFDIGLVLLAVSSLGLVVALNSRVKD